MKALVLKGEGELELGKGTFPPRAEEVVVGAPELVKLGRVLGFRGVAVKWRAQTMHDRAGSAGSQYDARSIWSRYQRKSAMRVVARS